MGLPWVRLDTQWPHNQTRVSLGDACDLWDNGRSTEKRPGRRANAVFPGLTPSRRG